MIFYAVISPAGYVVRVGRCAPDDLAAQPDEGSSAVEINARPLIRPGRRYKVQDGSVVEA